MCGVDDDGVGIGIDQCLHALQGVGCYTHAGSHAQASLAVFAGHGLVFGFGDVFVGDEAHQAVFAIHHGQFLDFVFLQDAGSGGQVSLDMCGHQILFGHHVIHLLVKAVLKAQVSVGDNTHQVVVVVNHRNAADMVFCHHVQCFLHC